MGNTALLYCSNEPKVMLSKPGVLEFIKKSVKLLFYKNEIGFEISRVEAGEDNPFFLIKLPYSLQELADCKKKRIAGIDDRIKHICGDLGIKECIVPEKVSMVCDFKSTVKNPYTGERLFKSLAVQIIKDLLKDRESAAFDTVIACGDDGNELYNIIMLMLPVAKYVFVMAGDLAGAEKVTGRIYDETGLSINLTDGSGNILKNCGLLINIDKKGSGEYLKKLNRNAVIVNYGGQGQYAYGVDNIIVNGIEVKLDGKTTKKLGGNVFGFFESAEISEMVLFNKLGYDADENFDECKLRMLSEKFLSSGYKISGYMGRRSVMARGNK